MTTPDLRQAFEKFGPLVEDQTYVRSFKYGASQYTIIYYNTKKTSNHTSKRH